MAVQEMQRLQFKNIPETQLASWWRIPKDHQFNTYESRDKTDKMSRLNIDIEHALLLKNSFYAALGIFPGNKEYEQKLSYEPWVERALFERLVGRANSQPDKELLTQGFKENSLVQLVTVLKERYDSEENKFRYNIKNGKLYSELLATEPFENVLLRGLEYKREEKSLELVREEKEVGGFIDVVQGFFCNPNIPIGTRMVLFSPPGLAKDSDYKKRFVDILELKQDTKGRRYVESIRFSSGLSYDGYRKAAKRLDPEYFDDYEASGLPLDAWFLSHPILIPWDAPFWSAEEIYDRFMEKDYEAMKEKQFQEVLRSCMPAIQYYIRELGRGVIDWRELAVSFNAILNIGDNAIEEMEKKKLFEDLGYSREKMLFWGQKETRTVAGGCPGVSSGFKIRYGFGDTSEALYNSLGKFGVDSDEYGPLEFACPYCEKKNKRPKGKLISNCQHCGQDVTC